MYREICSQCEPEVTIEKKEIRCLHCEPEVTIEKKTNKEIRCTVKSAIGKPRVSPLRFLNTSAVIRYLICVLASHFFAGRPYHFNQTLRTANKF